MTAKEWLQKAKDEKFAIGAFNVGNMETFKAIVMAAANKKSPIIIETSPGETEWMGYANMVSIAKNFEKEYGVPILVNLDHSTKLEDCQKGIANDFQLIHADMSKLDYDENVRITKQVAEEAHAKGLLCEGELTHIGGSSSVHTGSAQEEAAKTAMTEPVDAVKFVQDTGIDIFAAFVGNVHGLYQGGEKKLDTDRVKAIADATGAFLSLHGSSGIPEDQVKTAIENGIVKVNLNSEMRQAFRDTLEKEFATNKEYAMYKVMAPVLTAIQELVEHKIELFGSVNKVS
jgi:ketose-bisphosphate aldolase